MSRFGLDAKLMAIPQVAKAVAAVTAPFAPYVDKYVAPVAAKIVADPWLAYGIVPSIAVFIGTIVIGLVLDWIGRQPWAQKWMLTYSRKASRAEKVQETFAIIPYWEQFKGTLYTVAGPTVIVSIVAQKYLLEWLHGGVAKTVLPTFVGHCIDFALICLIDDFFLYCGHRVQHHVEYLWTHCHSVHHQLQTPVAASLAYIEPRDAFLQGVAPLLLAQLIMRVHPITHILYLVFRMGTNAVNHAGINAWWLNLIFGTWLPGRCDPSHHDAHHYFSGFGAGAKNHAEFFWIYDYLGGTYSQGAAVLRANAARE